MEGIFNLSSHTINLIIIPLYHQVSNVLGGLVISGERIRGEEERSDVA